MESRRTGAHNGRMTETAVPVRRTLLYMPGARIEIYPKALASGADMVCVDLEDAVAAGAKDATRAATLAVFAGAHDGSVERLMRINGVETEAGRADLAALAEADAGPDGVVIPKCGDPDHVRTVAEATRGSEMLIHPLIESARGLEAAFEIASADERVGFIMLGSQDMALDLRAEHAWEPLLYARSRLVAAARAAGIDVLDAPWFHIQDLDGLAAEAKAARTLGFTGKSLIHPTHVEAVNGVFSPTAEEVAEARGLIAKFDAQDQAAVMIDGQFLEPPIVERLKRIAAAGDRIGL